MGRIWTRLNPATLLVAVVPLVLVAAGLSGAVAGSRITLRSGDAWLASAQGQIILVSGSAARRVAAFPVSAPGQDLSVVETTDAVYLVNRTASTVTRMDAATFRVTPPVTVPGASGRLQVLAGGGRLYVLDGQTGLVQGLDPTTMAPLGSPRSLDLQVDPGGAVLDAAGRVWAAGIGSGVIRWLDESSVGTGMTVAGASLVLAGGAAVAVSAGRASWLTSAGDSAASVDLGALPGETLTVSGAPDGRLVVALPGRALVRTCERSGCDSSIGRLSDAGSRLGAPKLLGDVVLVPDLERGTIHLVRPGQGAEFAAAPVMPANTDFEVIVEDGFAFYNAVGNERAGVLRINGDFTPVQKYQPEDPSKGLDTLATSEASSSEVPTSSSIGPSTVSASPVTTTPTTATSVTTVRPTRTTVSTSATSRPVTPTTSAPPISTSSAPQATPVITDLRCAPATPAAGDQVTCTASESVAGAAGSWIWHVRDAATGAETLEAPTQPAGQAFVFTPARLGSFTVELTVDNRGARASATFALVSKVTIPDIRAKTAAEALDTLRALGLTVTSENRPSHAAVGTAIGTEPASVVAYGQPVTLLISSGPLPPIQLRDLAPTAKWSNGSGTTLYWNGNDGDPTGFVRPGAGLLLENDQLAPTNSFETHPEWIPTGTITGRFTLGRAILAGDQLTGSFGFLLGAGGYVRYSVVAVMPDGSVVSLGSGADSGGDGFVSPLGIDLTRAAGASALLLRVDAAGNSGQDWAMWIDPTIQ